MILLLGVAPWFSDFAFAGRPTVAPRVLIVIFNPVIEAQGKQRLVDLMGWNDPNSLSQEYAQVIQESSGGYVEYQVDGTIEIDGYPAKNNGHVFTDEEYLECLTPSRGYNCVLLIDYPDFLEGYGICSFANERKVTELWLWGGPWFGFWEAVQAGPHPISTNGPPILGTSCKRTLDIMGFNYERGLAAMLEDFAHRVDGNMQYVYGTRLPDETTPWNRFALLDRDVPGRGGCGNAHLAVNAAPGAELRSGKPEDGAFFLSGLPQLSGPDGHIRRPQLLGLGVHHDRLSRMVVAPSTEEHGSDGRETQQLVGLRHPPALGGITIRRVSEKMPVASARVPRGTRLLRPEAEAFLPRFRRAK